MLILLLPALGAAPPAQADTHAPSIRIEVGTTEAGHPTERWLAMLRRRVAPAAYDSAAALRKPLTGPERAWAELILARRERWEAELPELARLIEPVAPPAEAIVVLGNRGGEDAFVHDGVTIGFDLAALQRVYGEVGGEEGARRLDRLFRHEYVHLLQRAWLAAHPYEADSPLRAAIAEIWAEGMGTWYSMSARWRARDGRLSEAGAAALEELAPRFAERLETLACATPEQAAKLTADLSYGSFERKWGALPAALWIEAEASRSRAPEVLRRLVVEGPDGIWALADRHLPAPQRERLRRARERARQGC